MIRCRSEARLRLCGTMWVVVVVVVVVVVIVEFVVVVITLSITNCFHSMVSSHAHSNNLNTHKNSKTSLVGLLKKSPGFDRKTQSPINPTGLSFC